MSNIKYEIMLYLPIIDQFFGRVLCDRNASNAFAGHKQSITTEQFVGSHLMYKLRLILHASNGLSLGIVESPWSCNNGGSFIIALLPMAAWWM